MALSLEQFQERLRVWHARAAHEVENSDSAIAASWRGQQHVLGAIAMYMEGEGARYTPAQVRLRLIDDREAARRAWEAARDKREVATLAGEVAAYDLVLELLKDARRTWAVAGESVRA
jgi:hypothetical protein